LGEEGFIRELQIQAGADSIHPLFEARLPQLVVSPSVGSGTAVIA
jgi:hypothetical protein